MSTRVVEEIGPEMGHETAELSAESQALLRAVGNMLEGQAQRIEGQMGDMQAQIDRLTGQSEGDTPPPTPRRRVRQATGEGADDSGDASDRSRDIPAGLPGMGNGNGRGGNGGGRGRGERGDDDRNRGNWGRRVGAGLLVAAVAIGATLGIQRLNNDNEETKRTGETPERVTTPPERGGTNANQQVGPASKLGLSAGEYKRLAPVANNSKIDTVAEASRAYKGTNFDQIAQDILSNPDAFRNVDISHYLGRYISAPNLDESISNMTAMEVKLIGVVQDEANARSAANLVQGIAKEAERSDSHEEQIEVIRKYLLKPETKISRINLHGLWSNGTVNPNTLKVSATPTNFSGEDAISITDGNTRWIFKLDAESGPGNCFNDENDLPEPTPRVGTPDSPDGPPPTADREPEPERERRGRPPKLDRDGTPAGVPDRGRGTGTTAGPGPRGPGRGPAGQRVDPGTGRVPGEAPVEAQPQDPTPPRVEAQPAPAVTVDGDGDQEVVGGNPVNTPPATSPEVPANGSTTPAPTQEVNIDG